MANRPGTIVAAAFAIWQAERAIGSRSQHTAPATRSVRRSNRVRARHERCGSAVEGKVSGKAVRLHAANVRFWHKADITRLSYFTSAKGFRETNLCSN